MQLNKTLAFAVHFARTAEELGIPPADLAQMIAAARKSVKCYERNDTAGEQNWGEVVESYARKYGCVIDWPGLWPCVQKKNEPRTNRLLPAHD